LHFGGGGGGRPLKWFGRLELIPHPYPGLKPGAGIKPLKNVKKNHWIFIITSN